MITTRRLSHFTGVLITLLLWPHMASAACDSTGVTVADGRIFGPMFNSSNEQQVLVPVVKGHSYSFEVLLPQFAGPTVAELQPVYNIGLKDCPTTNPAGTRNTTLIDPVIRFTGTRLSFTPTTSSSNFVVRLGNSSSTAFTVSVTDTTMYSAAWSTLGTANQYNTHWSFLNTTNSSCTGTLTLSDNNGTPLNTTTFTVASGAKQSTDTATLGVGRDLSGSAMFTHDCPPDAFLVEAVVANFSLNPPYLQPIKFVAVRAAH